MHYEGQGILQNYQQPLTGIKNLQYKGIQMLRAFLGGMYFEGRGVL